MSRKIELELEVGGLDRVNSQVQQLESSLKKMKDQLTTVDQASAEYKNLTQSIKETEEQIALMNKRTNESTEASGSLRAQLRAVREELQQLEPGSARFQELTERAGQLTDQIADTQAIINATAGSPIENLATGLGTATRIGMVGFQGVQSAMALFGGQSEDLMKTMVKLQAVMGLTATLKEFGAMKDTFLTLKASFTAFSRAAMAGLSGIQKAIIATGIGALIVAIGLLVAYWDDIKGLVDGVTPEMKEQLEISQKRVVEAERELDALSNTENTMKLQGKTERQILDLRIAKTNEVIKEQEIFVKNMKQKADMEVAAAKRNQDITRQVIKIGLNMSALALRALAAQIDAVIYAANTVSEALGFGKITTINLNDEITKLIDKAADLGSEFLFDAEKVKKENDEAIKAEEDKLTKLKNQRDGYLLSIKAMDKAAADKALSESERRQNEILSKFLKDEERQKAARQQAEAEELKVLKGFERQKREFELEERKLTEDFQNIANAEAIQKLQERFVKEKMTIEQYQNERRKLEDGFIARLSEQELKNYQTLSENLAKTREEAYKVERERIETLKEEYDKRFNEKEKTQFDLEREALKDSNLKKMEELQKFYEEGIITTEEYSAKVIEIEKKTAEELNRIARKEKLQPYIGMLANMGQIFKNMAGEASGFLTNLSGTLVEGVGSILNLTLQEFKTQGEKIAAYAAVIGQTIQGIFSAIGGAQRENLNQNLQAVQESFNEEASALEELRRKGGVTEDQYARRRYEIELAAFNKSEELKRKAFEADKGLRIAQTIASGAQGAVAAFASAMTIPPPAGQIIGASLAGLMALMTAANVGIIAATKYEGGTPPQMGPSQLGGGVGGTTINQPGFGSTLFGTGGFSGNTGGSQQAPGGKMQIRAYVLESDITNTQNTITTLEERAEFG